MRRKYLLGPFIACFAGWTYGNGVLPLLPLYALELGASRTASGFFLAFAYLCIAVGTMSSGMLPETFRHRKLLIVASAVPFIVLTWLTGHVANVLQLAIVTGVIYLAGGVLLSQATVLVGLEAGPEERGTALGIVGMTNGLGGLVGGLGVGYIADRFGYRGVFTSLAVFCTLIMSGGLLSVEPRICSPSQARDQSVLSRRPLGGRLVLLLVAGLLVAVTIGPGNLGRSLSMNTRGFSKSAITLTASIQGAVSIGFPLLLGWLSDRMGRRRIMVAVFLAVSASLVLLAFSGSLWQFAAFAVLYAFLSVPLGIGPAFVADIVPSGNVAKGVSLFQAMFWGGSIAGMALTGYAFERLGIPFPVLSSALFPIAGAILLSFIRENKRQEATTSPAAG
jgi:MFS family permease